MTDIGPNQQGYGTLNSSFSAGSEAHRLRYMLEQVMGRANHAAIVQVKSVTNKGDLSPVGNVDVQPMVKLMDGQGTTSDHGVVNNLAYFRLQGGKNAIIMDPIVGDIGLAVFADRDISAVKNSKKISNPGSFRRNDMADGLFFPCFLGDTPENVLQFLSSGTIIGKTKKGATLCLSNTQNTASLKFGSSQFVVVTDSGIIVSVDPTVGPDPNPNNS